MTITGQMSSSDVDNGTGVVYSIITTVQHGVVTIVDAVAGIFSYIADLNWFGTDSFEYAVTDGSG